MPSPASARSADLPALLQALPPAVRGTLLEQTTRVPRGALLFRQGEPGDVAWLLLRGVLLVERTHALATEPQVLGVFSRGDLFGEVGLLQGAERTATGRALTDLELVPLPRERFERLLSEHAAFGAEIARCLAGRLMATNELLPGVPARLVALVGLSPSVADGLASALARQTARLVAVTAWPDARGLPRRLGVEGPARSTVVHPRGFHVLVHRGGPTRDSRTLLADTLRQRYGYALLCMDEWGPDAEELLSPSEPVLLAPGHPLPRRDFPPVVVGAEPDADLRLPREGAVEGLERAMTELARRVARSVPLTVRAAAIEPADAERLREPLRAAFGSVVEREADDERQLIAWAAPGELAERLEGLLAALASDPGLRAVEVGGKRLVL